MMQQILIESMTTPGVFYGIVNDNHGHITCTCPDYINRRAAKNEHCKHIIKYLETHPEVIIKDGIEYVRNKKGKLVSRVQYEHLTRLNAARAGKPAPKQAKPAAPQPAGLINTDAIAYIDAIQQIEKLGEMSENMKRSIIAGKTSSFVIDLPVIGAVLSCEKIGRGWRFKTIQKA